jgi:hypothetical protein
MTVLHTGSTRKYSENWASVFGKQSGGAKPAKAKARSAAAGKAKKSAAGRSGAGRAGRRK